MSSGVEADIALDAAVVLSLGMNRVLGKAGGLAGRGSEALAALAAGRAEARAEALAEVESHERALREVLERNARIAALAEARAKLGARVELPAPLQPTEEQSVEELTAWCAATDSALDAAERALSEHVAAEVTTQIFAAAEGLRADTSLPAAPAPNVEQAPPMEQALERILARLLPDTSEAELRAVAAAARLVADAPTADAAETALTEVRLRIQHANDHTRDLREQERRRAAEREAAEQAAAERRYVLDSITTAFRDLGYEVQAGFETLTPGGDGSLRLTKNGWPDHSVKMRVDDTQVRAAMVREGAAASEDDRRVDVEREREWCEAFDAARDRLEEAGVRSDVTWRLDPGVHELPVSADARQTRARTGQRERGRERGQ